jgi:hypothetical protein
MPRIFIPFATILAIFGLTGCRNSDSSTNPTSATQSSPGTPGEVLAASERHAEEEHTERLDTEAKLQQAEAAKSRWQTAALLLTSGALVLLIAGIVLGSKTRHHHETGKN